MSKPLENKVFDIAANLFSSTQRQNKSAEFFTPTPKTSTIENNLNAVFPILTQEAFALTLDRYRVYIAGYNYQTGAENRDIMRHNSQLKTLRASKPLTETEKKAVEMFCNRHKEDEPRNWNNAADDYNQKNGLLIHKWKIPTVKPATELVFTTFLYMYSKQVQKRTEQYMRFSGHHSRPLQEFELNLRKVSLLMRNGVQSLPMCERTVFNHRQRLEEAGVLLGYHFRGSDKAIHINFNPEIIAIFDAKTAKMILAENQLFKLPKRKEFLNENVCTRTVINDLEINENAKGNFQDKEFASLTPKPSVFYKNTTSKDKNSSLPPAPEGVKVSETLPQLASPKGRFAQTVSAGTVVANLVPRSAAVENDDTCSTKNKTLSDHLLLTVIDPQILAENLADRHYDNYTPIRTSDLEKEAYSGTLTNEQFRELRIQDFFKSAAKLHKNTSANVGSWKNAINEYYDKYGKSFTGKAFQKASNIQDIEELRWRIEWVRKYQAKHPDWNILFPSLYYDLTRKTAFSGGFEKTKDNWNTQKESLRKKDIRKQKQLAAAEKRKRREDKSRKCNTAIRSYLRGKLTLAQLCDYVEKLPKEFSEKLPQLVEKQRALIKRPSAFDDDFLMYNENQF